MKDNQVTIKAIEFAVKVVKFCKKLQQEEKEFILSKQLLRSGTSIGANLREAKFASSKADFLNKNKISLKEASETAYWLELLRLSEIAEAKELENDCLEIIKMLTAIANKLK